VRTIAYNYKPKINPSQVFTASTDILRPHIVSYTVDPPTQTNNNSSLRKFNRQTTMHSS